ncbi:MAG: SDR family oxidoreductase [Thermoplasmata archaeon]|nr:MAG: SDR family oxidoreductase [Thermoplasmata archaeon]
MENKSVLITGGGGFIGSHLVEALCDGNHVKVLDNFLSGKKENLKGLGVEIIEGSITNIDEVNRGVKDADFVLHLADLPSVPRSIRDPIQCNEVNIKGTMNILIASKERGVKKVIFASSSSVYGDTPTLPKVETMPPNPQSPYAVSKLAGEHYCRVFYQVYDLPTTSLRFFNVYGPRQDPKSEYAAVIPKFITRLNRNEPPIIFGDGEQTRDFTYVKDAVNAVILAGESNKTCGEAINIACGKRTSIKELASKIAGLLRKNINAKHTEERPGDVKHSLADITRAIELMDFMPRYSLEEGLKVTINYIKGQK